MLRNVTQVNRSNDIIDEIRESRPYLSKGRHGGCRDVGRRCGSRDRDDAVLLSRGAKGLADHVHPIRVDGESLVIPVESEESADGDRPDGGFNAKQGPTRPPLRDRPLNVSGDHVDRVIVEGTSPV
jgi:hypothetical protein